jgi:cell division protein FtsB
MKLFVAFLLIVLIGLQYRLWVSDDGVRSLMTLRRSVAAQKAENAELLQRNSDLAGEVKGLKAGVAAAVEERARYDLGMIGPGETFFQILDPPTNPAPQSAQSTPPSPVQRTAQ